MGAPEEPPEAPRAEDPHLVAGGAGLPGPLRVVLARLIRMGGPGVRVWRALFLRRAVGTLCGQRFRGPFRNDSRKPMGCVRFLLFAGAWAGATLLQTEEP